MLAGYQESGERRRARVQRSIREGAPLPNDLPSAVGGDCQRIRARATCAHARALHRTIAAHVEELPLDAAAEVLVLLEPAVAALEREAAFALERAPASHS